MEGKKDVDYKSQEYVNSLLRRISAEAHAVITENVEEIERKYGTVRPTVEQILEELYEKSAGSIEKALAINLLLVDVYHWHILPLPLLTYNIGVLRALLAGPPEAEQVPPDLETLLEGLKNLPDKSRVYSELGKEAVDIRWSRRDEALEKVKAEARKRWLEWKQKGGKKIYHNKMADVLFKEMTDELSKAGVTRPMLIKAFREIAREIDPSLVFGVKIEK